MNTGHFYHRHIQTAVAVFGSIFNDLTIKRKDGKVIPVPISYGPRDKLIEGQKLQKQSEEALDRILPRMSYELMAMNYDAERKLTNKMNQIRTPDNISAPRQHTKVPVPYNLNFNLYCVTKNLNDGWQVVEQILPFFAPNYSVRVRQFPIDTNPSTPHGDDYFDLPITLETITWADDYQGAMADRRIVEWSLEFSVKINMYGPISESGVIYDSRVIVQRVPTETNLNALRRDNGYSGTELGYVNLDSELQTPSLSSDSEFSPTVLNLYDSDGAMFKIVRTLPESV